MEALTSGRARQEDVRRIYDEKCNEAAVAETNHTNATQGRPLGKAEALQKHVVTVTMRADSLLTTERPLLTNDPRAARRSTEPLERALGTAAYGGSCTKSLLTFDSPKPRDWFSQRSLSLNHEMTHEYEPLQLLDDDSESDQCWLSDKQHARCSSAETSDQTRQWSKPSHRVRLLNFALLAPTRIVLLQKTRRPAS